MLLLLLLFFVLIDLSGWLVLLSLVQSKPRWTVRVLQTAA